MGRMGFKSKPVYSSCMLDRIGLCNMKCWKNLRLIRGSHGHGQSFNHWPLL